jgi:hypothetical protein
MAESAPPSAGPIPLELPAGVHQLCRCGRSRHGWFCDGAHLGTGWVSRELRLDQASTVVVWAAVCPTATRSVMAATPDQRAAADAGGGGGPERLACPVVAFCLGVIFSPRLPFAMNPWLSFTTELSPPPRPSKPTTWRSIFAVRK